MAKPILISISKFYIFPYGTVPIPYAQAQAIISSSKHLEGAPECDSEARTGTFHGRKHTAQVGVAYSRAFPLPRPHAQGTWTVLRARFLAFQDTPRGWPLSQHWSSPDRGTENTITPLTWSFWSGGARVHSTQVKASCIPQQDVSEAVGRGGGS